MTAVTAPFDEAAEPERTPTWAEIDHLAEGVAQLAAPVFAANGWRWGELNRRGNSVPSEARIALAVRHAIAAMVREEPGFWRGIGRLTVRRMRGGVTVFLELGELNLWDLSAESDAT